MNRIVVTGVGILSPVGKCRDTFWDSVLNRRHGFAKIRSFDTAGFNVNQGAEVHDFEPAAAFKRLNPADVGRASQLAIGAADQALQDAHLERGSRRHRKSHRIGVSIGTTSGEPRIIEAVNDCLRENRQAEVDPRFTELYPCHSIAAHVAQEFELGGINRVIPTACAAGNYALADAVDVLQAGRADVMLAGGADSFSRITYSGFYRLGAISPDIVRPFDNDRQGMIPGEGAGVLVLETEQHAKERGAHIYAEVAGYGLSCDAHHMTGPHPDGDGAARAMIEALRCSSISAEDVEYVCAHGTGTRVSDKAETSAIRQALGEQANRVAVSSLKSMLGHTMGAASAIESVACCLALQHQQIPPTANFQSADPACDLDFVTEGAREMKLTHAMNTANAFGGSNAVVIFRRYQAGGGR